MSNRRFICDYEDGPCRMRIRMLLAALIFVILLSAKARPQSSYISGIAGPTSSPVSQTQQGLFRSPNRYDISGNSLIAGNVRGGTYFHGPVPYPSTTSFYGSVPSADTTYSFMRYSAGSEDFARVPGKYSQTMPYYNPSQTVTFTRPGQSGVFTPTNASVIKSASSGTGVEFIQATQPSGQILSGTTSAFGIGAGPMSMSQQETESLISAEVGGLIEPRAEQVNQRAADLRIRPIGKEGIQQRFELAGQPYAEESVPEEDMAVRRIERERMLEQMREQMLTKSKVESEDHGETSAGSVETLRRAIDASVSGKEVTAGEGGEQQDLLDTYTRVKKQIDNLQDTLKQLKAGKGAEEATSVKSVLERSKTVEAEKVPDQLNFRYSGNDPELQAFRKNIEHLAAENEQKDKLSSAGISAEAKRILGGKSMAAFSEDKYNEYMKAAELYQKQGRHYRAASAYTLALIYKPGEPLAYAGRSLALFAAGEYMSSALYLSRAIEISPEYAKTKVDLLAILGTDDKEQLNNRIDEIEQWYKRSDEADLKFLLGYIYYQAGEFDKAKEAIDAAHTMKPNSPAVDALRKAIEEK